MIAPLHSIHWLRAYLARYYISALAIHVHVSQGGDYDDSFDSFSTAAALTGRRDFFGKETRREPTHTYLAALPLCLQIIFSRLNGSNNAALQDVPASLPRIIAGDMHNNCRGNLENMCVRCQSSHYNSQPRIIAGDMHNNCRGNLENMCVRCQSSAIGTLFRDFSKTEDSPSGIASNPKFFGFLPDQTYRALALALDMGYNHIDTALVYRTQKAIGAVLASRMMEGKLKREDIFITSKLYHGEMPGITRRGSTLPLDTMTPEEVADKAEEQFEMVLEELGVGYVDVMLMHWPAIMDSKDEGNAARRLAAWKVFENFYENGIARAIGVSNFSEHHIEQLMKDGAKVLPHINQIEASLYKSYDDIKSYCDEKGIKLMAYSPLGLGKQTLLNDPIVKNIAEAKGVAPSQVALRFLIQEGYAVLPMSTNEDRMKLNLDLFSFEIADDEMNQLRELKSNDEGGIGLPSPYGMS